MLKNDNPIIIEKKIKNLMIWLLLWYKNSPPSVEYMEKLLMIPNKKIHNIKVKSKDLIFWNKFNELEYEVCWNI